MPTRAARRLHVDGELTIGENLADLCGLPFHWTRTRLAGQKGRPPNDPFTASSFCPGSYRIWREKTRPQAQIQRLATDPHSPSEFRCNQVVRNIAQFYTTFKVTPGDHLYLPESQRVTI